MLVEHELVQALHGAGRSRLQLDRDDAALDHHEVVDLPGPTALSLPVEELRAVAGERVDETQLLSRQLVGQLAAHCGREVVPGREGRCRRRPEERVGQPDVGEDGLAEGVLRRGREGQPIGRAVPNQVAHASTREQLEGTPGLVLFHPVPELRVHELAAERAGHRTQGGVQHVRVHPAGVLGEVRTKSGRQVALELAAGTRATTARVGLHDRGHAPHHRVAVEPLRRPIVRGLRQRRASRPPLRERPQQSLLAVGLEELGKPHRLDVLERDAPYRHAERAIPERELEQRPGGHHRERGDLLVEPPELGEHRGDRLNLVEKQQAPPRRDVPAEDQRQLPQDRSRIVRAEVPGERRIALEVDLGQLEARPGGEVADKPGLAHLPGATKDEGLAVRRLAKPAIERHVQQSVSCK